MVVVIYTLIFISMSLITSFGLWLASRINFVQLDTQALVVISITVSLLSLIPYVGLVVGVLFFIVMLKNVSGCSLVDAFWVIFFTRLFSQIPVVIFGALLLA